MPALTPSPFRLALCFLFCATLRAQESLADAEEQRRRSQAEAEAREELQLAPKVRLQEPGPLPEAGAGLDLPVETPRFRIDRLILALPPGPHAQEAHRAFGFARSYLAQYEGRDLGAVGIRLILQRLTLRILARGYTTTRVDLAEQDLRGGTLTITLTPGVISSIRFQDPALGGTWRNAFPIRPGALLNLRDLEQGLEQMKRVQSQDVLIALTPGALPGESEVVLTVRRGRPWRGVLSLDDSGLPATGPWQAGLATVWDNPLGASDVLTASLNHDATAYLKGTGTRGGALTYALPFGYWTFALSGSQSAFDQRIQGLRQELVSSGVTRNLELRVGYLFHRNQTCRNTVQVRVGNRTSRAFLNDTELTVQRRHNSSAELSLSHTRYLGAAQLDLTAALRQGVSWFGAQKDLPGGPMTFFYRMQTLDASLTAPFTLGSRRLQYTATVRAQHTANALYATDQFTIGNRWTVRGFDGGNTLASDNGVFLRNDLESPLGRGASVYLGVDAGRVQGAHAQTLPGRTLAGMVFGLKGVFMKRLNFNVFLGGPLHQPACFAKPWLVAGISAGFHF